MIFFRLLFRFLSRTISIKHTVNFEWSKILAVDTIVSELLILAATFSLLQRLFTSAALLHASLAARLPERNISTEKQHFGDKSKTGQNRAEPTKVIKTSTAENPVRYLTESHGLGERTHRRCCVVAAAWGLLSDGSHRWLKEWQTGSTCTWLICLSPASSSSLPPPSGMKGIKGNDSWVKLLSQENHCCDKKFIRRHPSLLRFFLVFLFFLFYW